MPAGLRHVPTRWARSQDTGTSTGPNSCRTGCVERGRVGLGVAGHWNGFHGSVEPLLKALIQISRLF